MAQALLVLYSVISPRNPRFLFFGTVYGVLLALKDPVLTETADAIRSRLKGRNIG